jgi:hypothetical protein
MVRGYQDWPKPRNLHGERIMFDYCTLIFLCYVTSIQQMLDWNATPKRSAHQRLVRFYSTETLRPCFPSPYTLLIQVPSKWRN